MSTSMMALAAGGTPASSCGASFTVTAVFQMSSSCARTTSPGKGGSSIFGVDLQLSRPPSPGAMPRAGA
eukprot:382483-Prymnesium_polylepis.1